MRLSGDSLELSFVLLSAECDNAQTRDSRGEHPLRYEHPDDYIQVSIAADRCVHERFIGATAVLPSAR
jgi:hypothetical protein